MTFVAFRSRLVLSCAVGVGAVCLSISANAQTPQSSEDSRPAALTSADSSAQDSPTIERAALADLDLENSAALAGSTSRNTSAPVDTTNQKPDRCDITSLVRCIKDILGDQAGIWTSPIRIHKRDLIWLLPLGAATGAALSTDKRVSNDLGFTATTRIRISKDFSDGMEDLAWATAGGLYIFGKVTNNGTARETGVLGVEAGLDATIVAEIIKLATNRLRPNVASNGPFWQDDTYTTNGSFPSGHSILVWSIAKVISDETPGNVWFHILLYLGATATAVTRVTAQEHFPSDVIVGSALGYLIGGYVYRHHSDASGREGQPVQIMPFANAATHSAGLAVSLDPSSVHLPTPHQLLTSLRSGLPFRAPTN